MSKKPSVVTETGTLRQRAETQVNEEAGYPREFQGNAAQLLHELQVHQVELEMQNEELRRTQVELEYLRARYFDLYDLAPVGYLVLSEKGMILETNLTAATLLGVTKKNLQNQLFSRFILREHQDIFFMGRKLLAETGQAQTLECQILGKAPVPFWARLEMTFVQNLASLWEFRVMLSDISPSKLIEAQLVNAKATLDTAHAELQRAFLIEKQAARTDSLTGQYNRRHFFEYGDYEFNVSLRYESPLTVIMFDVDHLKVVNDTLGHLAGDNILKAVAQAAVAELRAVDVLARYGGDEFAILLPKASAEQAGHIAERIREKVAAIGAQFELAPGIATLSIGIAEMCHHPQDRSVENIVQRADHALYIAKNDGRNRTVIFGETPQPGAS